MGKTVCSFQSSASWVGVSRCEVNPLEIFVSKFVVKNSYFKLQDLSALVYFPVIINQTNNAMVAGKGAQTKVYNVPNNMKATVLCR